MLAIEELRDENNCRSRDMAKEVVSEGLGLRGSSSHMRRPDVSGEGRPSSMEDARDITRRRKGCTICPMRGAGDVYVDLRSYPMPCMQPQVTISPNAACPPLVKPMTVDKSKVTVNPYEDYPAGHFMSDVYPINFPRSHFASLPPLGTGGGGGEEGSTADPLLAYLSGAAPCPPVDTPRADSPIKGVSYINPKTGELVDMRNPRQDAAAPRIPLDTKALGARASYRVVQRSCRITDHAKLPPDSKLLLFGTEGKVLSEIEIAKRIERRVQLQALDEGRCIEPEPEPRANIPDAAPSQKVENATVRKDIMVSSPIVRNPTPGADIADDVVGDLDGIDGEEDLNALLDWAQNLDPDSIV